MNLLETEVKFRDLSLIDSKWIPPPWGGGVFEQNQGNKPILEKNQGNKDLGGFEQLGEATRPGILWLQNQCFRG